MDDIKLVTFRIRKGNSETSWTEVVTKALTQEELNQELKELNQELFLLSQEHQCEEIKGFDVEIHSLEDTLVKTIMEHMTIHEFLKLIAMVQNTEKEV